jgi:co-chaperonin GroES (HSP10)
MADEIRPYLGQVAVKPREDLDPTSPLFVLPQSYRLTAATDDVGVCEVVAVGEPAYDKWGRAASPAFKVGDICMIGFGEVKQGFTFDMGKVFVANHDSIFAKFNADGTCEPYWDYVITKRAPLRMTRAVIGKDHKNILPDSILSAGVPSGEIRHHVCGHCGAHNAFPQDAPSEPVTYVVYEEVVRVGPGVEVYGVLREPDVKPGELVCFGVHWAMGWRANGEYYRAVRFGNLLAGLDR